MTVDYGKRLDELDNTIAVHCIDHRDLPAPGSIDIMYQVAVESISIARELLKDNEEWQEAYRSLSAEFADAHNRALEVERELESMTKERDELDRDLQKTIEVDHDRSGGY